MYVGSIILYSQVTTYFLPPILSKADRRVLRYFNKYGFKDVKLSNKKYAGSSVNLSRRLTYYFSKVNIACYKKSCIHTL